MNEPLFLLAAIAIIAAVALVVLFGRDPKADVRRPPGGTPARAAWPLVDRKPMPARPALRPSAGSTALDILPPAPPGMDAGSPLWRELVVETAVPTLSDDEVRDIAARWLREAGEQARAEMAGAR